MSTWKNPYNHKAVALVVAVDIAQLVGRMEWIGKFEVAGIAVKVDMEAFAGTVGHSRHTDPHKKLDSHIGSLICSEWPFFS